MSHLLECKNISKSFYGTRALENVDFYLDKGEIIGLVGENGAGKSTLMKIVSGVYAPDVKKNDSEMGIYLEGKKLILNEPLDSIKNGIVTIHQEINVLYDLMVYENIFLNNYIFHKSGFLDRKTMIKRCAELLAKYGITDISPTDMIKDLAVDKQKLVEVIKALGNNAQVIILDEPTSVLSQDESKYLFEIMTNISKQGKGIVFISHNLKEITDYCTRVVILRDGKLVKTAPIEEMDLDSIVSCMMGQRLDDSEVYEKNHDIGDVLLKVKDLNYKNKLHDISFELKKGEILGITGQIGSGGNDIARCLFGCAGYRDGISYEFDGKRFSKMTPEKAISNGIAFLTDDRKAEGIFHSFSVTDNVIFPSIKRFSNKLGFIQRKEAVEQAEKQIELLHVKTPSTATLAGSLSGGNQQKIVISKWLTANPKLLILSGPTIGIDVGAKHEIKKIIKSLSAQGLSIILITDEYAEMEKLCDRVLIMHKGTIIKEFANDELSEEEVMRYKLGGYKK